MTGPRYINFDTLSLHAGQQPDPATGARATPIYQTTSYVFRDSDHAAALFNAERPGHVYSRITNPTTAVLEERIAALEGGVGAIATASGQAAMHLAIATIVSAGEHIVASSALYGGSHNLLSYTLPRFGIETTFVDPRDPGAFRAAIRPETRLVFSETLGNPGLDVLDIPAVAEVAHEAGSRCSSTPRSPPPTCCVRSITARISSFTPRPKFLGGHGVAIGGVLVDGGTFDWDASGRFPTLCEPYDGFHDLVFTEEYGPAAFIMRARKEGARDFGACMSPPPRSTSCRGLKRSRCAWSDTSRTPARWSSSWTATTRLQMSSIRAARAPGPRAREEAVAARLRGGVQLRARGRTRGRPGLHRVAAGVLAPRERRRREILVIHPASTTHHRMDAAALARAGISEGTVRLSIGLEDIDDLLDDLGRALHRSQRARGIGTGARRAAS